MAAALSPSQPPAAAATAAPQDGFQRLSSSVSISPGAAGETAADKTAPTLIVMLSWMAASPRNARSYLARYRAKYPAATIIHVATGLADVSFRPTAVRQRELAPVVDAIAGEAAAQPRGRVLLHIFSNGGAFTAAQLADAYHRRGGAGAALPADAVVLDSAPGRPDFALTYRALYFPLRAVLPLGVAEVATALMTVALHIVFIFSDPVGWARGSLNDPQTVNGKAPRLYLYSKADELVNWEHVEEHMADAKAAGLTVRGKFFEKSKHVAHVMADKEGYWSAVDDLWASTLEDV